MSWFEPSFVYQIYPLGLCGAPHENDGVLEHRLLKLVDDGWVDHMARLGVTCLLLNPVFESDSHGYDTRDYTKVDCRLGTNEDLRAVVDACHAAGIRVLLDGVFNHVGRGFWAFRDVLERRGESPYVGWFEIDFNGDNCFGDGLSYSCWEGAQSLVKLNHWNGELNDYLASVICGWVREFDIDGLRLDVAYCIDRGFLARLRSFCDSLKPGFFLVGEMIGGDYNQIMGDNMCHSATNYECRKGLYSSLNSMNLFEIGHSLQRQFGKEQWCLYRGRHLLSFADNHDVTRAASILTQKEHLPLLYALVFGMPGIPCVYYGSEWGAEGRKEQGDAALRPAFEKPVENELTEWIGKLAGARTGSRALRHGDFKILVMTNKQLIFERSCEGERVLVAVNADAAPYVAHFNANAGRAVDLISGKSHDFGGGSELPAYSAFYWLTE